MKKYITLSLFFFFLSTIYANPPHIIRTVLKWEDTPILHNLSGAHPLEIYAFEGGVYHPAHPTLPVFMARFPVESHGKLQVELISARYVPMQKPDNEDDRFLSEFLQFNSTVESDRGQFFGKVFFIPIRKSSNGQFEKVVSFELRVTHTPTLMSVARGPNTFTSVLKGGEIYKIAVSHTGIHKMDYNFLQSELNINVENIDPRRIQLFGNGGGVLPEPISVFRQDDLMENAIAVIGESDGRFDENDYILFHGEGPDVWNYNESEGIFDMERNTYTNKSYYFLKIGGDAGLRIAPQASMASTETTTTTFDHYLRLEEDRFNLLSDFISTTGSGREWYGDHFDLVREKTYVDYFTFPNILTNSEGNLKAVFAGRSPGSSRFNINIGGQEHQSSLMAASDLGDIEKPYAKKGHINTSFLPAGEVIPVTVRYPSTGSNSEGWLDYIQINARCMLSFSDAQLIFRDIGTLAYNSATFEVKNVPAAAEIWDISNPLRPYRQSFAVNGNQVNFGVSTSNLKEFICFDTEGALFTPEATGVVPPQNLHGITDIDMVIIYHQDFEEAAIQLAEHRKTHSGLEVKAVEIDQVYNEFSSGAQDPTAIRDFAKMLYDRNPDRFRYLLLFGDASFDYKNNNNLEDAHHFVPTYETEESLAPLQSFPSDDYFGLLSDNEGGDLKGALDIGVGRLPARTRGEAQILTDKILHYDTSPSTLSDWRLKLAFVADDEDGNTHLRQADEITQFLDDSHKRYNLDKIYLDAHPQVATPGGEKYPSVNEAINRAFFKGMLAINYLGHGGPKGWAQERVLTIEDINTWDNADKLPLMITATCSFTGYDEPTITTGGEACILRENGGVIALFTTTRAVYSSSNERLTDAVFDHLFERENGTNRGIGEILRLSKNSNSADTTGINSRKFSLIGDPALQLSIPTHDIVATRINMHDLWDGQVDTLRALQQVSIEGEIQDASGNILSDFNGELVPTIFDKKITAATLGQGSSSREFFIQKNVIFRGRASVRNGRFQFTFIVPKDINYEYGPGKISFYAQDGVRDAAGYYDNIIIGGTDETAVADDKGPEIEVYMNDEQFVFGGITDESPILLVNLSDDNGINVTGSSIGHDLTGILDEDTQNTFLLNDFYESALDDYRKGAVRFPLSNLEEGLHNIRVKAWDVANNSSEGYTEFVVASSAEIALRHILNYPNPFTESTRFQFEHNFPNQPLDVQVQIFTVSGRLIKTIEEQVLSDGFLVTDLNWDGRDEFGDKLGRGVYLYRVKIGAFSALNSPLKAESDFKKLVILK